MSRAQELMKGKFSAIRSGHLRRTHAPRYLLHELVAMEAIGKELPINAVVHHVNSDPSDNRPQNLVICQDQAYHMLIHARTRVWNAGGDPDTDKICSTCQTLKTKHLFTRNASTWDGLHPECRMCKGPREAERKRRRRAERREAALVA